MFFFTAVNIQVEIFWVVRHVVLWYDINVSGDLAASVFKGEDGGSEIVT
jgi:hypothetical protein